MKEPIQKYTHLGKTVLLLPGSRFTKNELNSRLHQMDVQYDQTNQTKKYFINLYENALKYDVNKQKIFEKLLKDTIYYNNVQNSINKDSPNKMETPTKNNNFQKVSIINNRPVNENELTNRQKINNNNININEQQYRSNNLQQNNYSHNQPSIFNDMVGQNNNRKNEHQYSLQEIIANEIKKNKNNININNQSNDFKNNNNNQSNYTYHNIGKNFTFRPIPVNQSNEKVSNNEPNHYNRNEQTKNVEQSRDINYNNQSNNYTNSELQKNYNTKNNQLSYNQPQKYDSTNNNLNNIQHNYNNNNNNQKFFANQGQMQNYNQTFIPNYQNQNSQNNYMNNKNNYSNNQEDIDERMYQNYNNQNQTPKYNNDNNLNSISLSIQNAIKDNNNNGQMTPSGINNNNYQNNRRPRQTNNMSVIHESDNDDEDDKSNFSFTSNINRVKNYFNNKENRDFCYNILKIIIIGIILLIIVSYGLRFSRSIADGATKAFDTVTNPRRILKDIIWGIIKGIIVGLLWNNIYYIIPLVIISFVGYIYVDKYNFKKKCKQIVEDIKKELRRKPMDNNGMRTISENEIISRYSQKYNIDRATFETRYLKYLNKLRSKDKSLKEHQNYNEQGKIMKYWFLNE